jgi:proteasome lid subunit RPN8/RPN11
LLLSLSSRRRSSTIGATQGADATSWAKQRFNAYALAAHPREIGGLLRIVEDDECLRVIDVKIFPHVAASGGYFELDGAEIARWNMELFQSGRKHELTQWCSLVHSHPNMSAFLSGTDHQNLFTLAGQGRAFSLIAATTDTPQDNSFKLFYAQGAPLKVLISDVPFSGTGELVGTELISQQEQEAIRQHVIEALPSSGWHGFRS